MEKPLFLGVAVSAVVAVGLGAALLVSCSADDRGVNPCGSQPIVYVESDDDETEYHCGSATGIVVPLILIDTDTRAKAKLSPGKPVPFKPLPKPSAPPKQSVQKPAAPAPVKPPAPAKPPAPKPR